MAEDVIVVELTGDFPLDADETLAAADPDQLVDVALGTGFGAERVLTFLAGLSKPAVEAVKKLVLQAVGANRVTGFKVTKDGVEVASFPVEGTEQVEVLISTTLDKLRERQG